MEYDSLLVERMDAQVRAWEANADARAVFLSCYTMMTRNMLSAIDGGAFRDPAWVRALLERFSDYYFDALTRYDRGEASTPAAWIVAHDAARGTRANVLQLLFLGVNAHINFDLALTLVDMLSPEWHDDTAGHRRMRHEDYCHVNDIIARTIDEVQDRIIDRAMPWMGVLDTVLGRADERAITRLIARWREQVWTNAESLLDTRSDERRGAVIGLIEAMAVERAEAMLKLDGLKSLLTVV